MGSTPGNTPGAAANYGLGLGKFGCLVQARRGGSGSYRGASSVGTHSACETP